MLEQIHKHEHQIHWGEQSIREKARYKGVKKGGWQISKPVFQRNNHRDSTSQLEYGKIHKHTSKEKTLKDKIQET